jgi:TonB family protein
LFVDVKGDVRRFHIVKADPRDVGFEDEVLKVIPRWKFTPALQQQRPVGVWVTIPVKFEIK